MFTTRDLPADLEAVREATAPETEVVDCEREFETMPAEWVYELALITEDLEALRHPATWVPEDAIAAARRTTGRDPAIGMPDDGTVAWTRQTEPPFVFVKPRASGLPDDFRDFLIGEALLEVGLEVPETPIGFFREDYRTIQSLVGSPTAGFQVAAALRRGWIGLRTREHFAGWADEHERLHTAWQETGARLEERVSALPSLLADGEMAFADATELACNAIKHDLELPAPFAALDVEAFAEQGAPFARRWVEESFPDV